MSADGGVGFVCMMKASICVSCRTLCVGPLLPGGNDDHGLVIRSEI